MAHFARINDDGLVDFVMFIHNDDCLNSEGYEDESVGASFCSGLMEGTWVQTSYNSSFRKNFAGIGYTYDAQQDAFIPPQPFESWRLNAETFIWEPPVPFPADGKAYNWDESVLRWVELER